MFLKFVFIVAIGFLLQSCKKPELSHTYEDYHPLERDEKRDKKLGSLLTGSDEPIVIYGDTKKKNSSGSTVASSYLWKAALDSISFMPLASVDANGGVILTEWYSSPEKPNERFKFNVIILNPEIQISSIKVKAFKQVAYSGGWKSVNSHKDLEKNMEDIIIQKAIALKNSSSAK